MKKVYQTDTTNTTGNCMQSVVASLFELDLNLVPHFLLFGGNWEESLKLFLNIKGYKIEKVLYNLNYYNNSKLCGANYELKKDDCLSNLSKYEGVDGFFDASVGSPKYFKNNNKLMHAVISDSNYKIVHDPNINYKNINQYPLSDEIGYNGIFQIIIYSKL